MLTEPTRFGGSLDDLRAVAAAVDLPVLRKDFIVDRGQVWEAAEAGAAAVLLIVAILSDDRLHDLLIEALDCGLDPLVEVHDLDETRRACSAGCTLVGINNRDLVTLEVDLETTEYLAPALGPCMFPVSESGISTPADACRAALAGARALLVGETLVRTPPEDLPRTHRQPQGPGMAGMTRVKVCGLTRAEDVRLAAELGAWALGFVLAESPRHVVPSAPGTSPPRPATPSRWPSSPRRSPAWIAAAPWPPPASAPCSSRPAPTARRSPQVRAAAAQAGVEPLVIAAADTPDAQLADFVLLDARGPGSYGGTGRRLDWERLAADPATPRKDLVLAGGPQAGHGRRGHRRAAPRRRRRLERRRVGARHQGRAATACLLRRRGTCRQ